MQKPGIEIRILARQIGVAASDVLRWCSAEGLGDSRSTIRTKISFGLAETIREHFAAQANPASHHPIGEEACAV